MYSSGSYLLSLLALGFVVALIRLPALLLENGGGAFLLLFFAVVHVLIFPLLVAEKCYSDVFSNVEKKWLLQESEVGKRTLTQLFTTLQTIVTLGFLWLFLYLSGRSLFSLLQLFKTPVLEQGYISLSGDPFFAYSSAWTLVPFVCFLRWGSRFLRFTEKYLLPLSFAIFLILFLKIMLSVSSYQGFKVLFYPDFSSINRYSLIEAIGLGVASLLAGFGLLHHKGKQVVGDPIETLIGAVIQSVFMALFVGSMILPMMEQSHEYPLGIPWVFETIPRWLSYGQFPLYYGALFFVALFLVSFYGSLTLFFLLFKGHDSFKGRSQWKISFLLVGNALATALLSFDFVGGLGLKLQRWLGGATLYFLLPALALCLIVNVFLYTNSKQRVKVFSKQQIFFHNQIFFRLWEFLLFFLAPSLIFLAWVLVIIF